MKSQVEMQVSCPSCGNTDEPVQISAQIAENTVVFINSEVERGSAEIIGGKCAVKMPCSGCLEC
jgi:hypothetical protein